MSLCLGWTSGGFIPKIPLLIKANWEALIRLSPLFTHLLCCQGATLLRHVCGLLINGPCPHMWADYSRGVFVSVPTHRWLWNHPSCTLINQPTWRQLIQRKCDSCSPEGMVHKDDGPPSHHPQSVWEAQDPVKNYRCKILLGCLWHVK